MDSISVDHPRPSHLRHCPNPAGPTSPQTAPLANCQTNISFTSLFTSLCTLSNPHTSIMCPSFSQHLSICPGNRSCRPVLPQEQLPHPLHQSCDPVYQCSLIYHRNLSWLIHVAPNSPPFFQSASHLPHLHCSFWDPPRYSAIFHALAGSYPVHQPQ
jgi:hypothetical protein